MIQTTHLCIKFTHNVYKPNQLNKSMPMNRDESKRCVDPYTDLEMKVEEMSHTVCEECAKPGETRDLNWIRTLCDEHYQSRKRLGGSIA